MKILRSLTKKIIMGNFDCFGDSYCGVTLFHPHHPDTERYYL